MGMASGLDEDEMVEMEFGKVEGQYKEKIRDKVRARADEMQRQADARAEKLARSYVLGKEAYECGKYPQAVKLLELGVEEAGENTVAGGESQLWLALAYVAVGREADAIALWKYVEANHPLRKIKKQAGDMRYIMEAPKLEVADNEFVKIPLISSDNTSRKPEKRASGRPPRSGGKVETSYWDKASWDIKPEVGELKWYYQVLIGGVVLMALVEWYRSS
ncbi:hypothetical protein FOA52_013964 [Chlamydomonas sp. UWO 241]|nr:hypothetical protein FOA52_013964 [Chlamydomonas sp. UWO 241]